MESEEVSSTPSSARSEELAPIRTGREAPPDNLSPPPSTVSDDYSDTDDVILQQQREPLPPIGSPGRSPEHSDVEVGTATSSLIAGTMAGSGGRQQPTRRPKITQSFRREIEQEEPLGDLESFSDPVLSQKKLGFVTESATIETQTEWSWLQDMEMIKKTKAVRMSAKSEATTSDEEDSQLGREEDLDVRPEADGGAPAEDGKMKPKTAESKGRGLESEMTFASSSSVPYPPKDDEYGIPILHLSSESEDSDDESEILYQREDEPEDEMGEPGVLPTIGPPEILKYQKEGAPPDLADPDARLLSEEDIQTAQQLQQQAATGGVFEGTCEFCGNSIKPFPSLDDQKFRAPEDIYCCNDYQEFVLFMVRHPIQQEHHADKPIDIKPHPPYGSKQARRAAKEKAMARMREREMQRQQQAMAAAGVGGGGGGGGGGGANFYQFARQMKTINYQLSSQKCMEEGWTLRPQTPKEDDDNVNDIFEPEPLLPFGDSGARTERRPGLVKKYYEDGNLFVILFGDGTGSVFYHSGRIGVTIASCEPGLFTYVVQDDTEEGRVMAVFEPNGCGCVYFNNGVVRLCMDPIGGCEADAHGVRKKKWSWKDWKTNHVHAPPIQPITFAITPHIGLRIMTQELMSVTFSCGSRRARFQVGSRLKLLARPVYPLDNEIDEDDLYRKEVQASVQSLFDKVTNLLKFPNSPKLHKLPTPGHLSSRVQKLGRLREEREENKLKRGQTVVTVN